MKKSSLCFLWFMSIFFAVVTIEPVHSHAQLPVTELLVEYAEDARMNFSEEFEGQVEVRKRISSDVELWSLKEGTDVEALRQELQEDPNVLFVESNVKRQLAAEPSEDPFIGEQWWLPHVGAEVVWSRVSEQKRRVTVAVIDSGIDTQHLDLQKRIQPGGQNFYDNTSNLQDETGHGTKVSGIIAAEYGNGEGVSGIAGPFDVKILPLKVFGAGQTTKTSYIVAAIDYAVKLQVDVINLSLGGPVKSDIEERAIQSAIQAGVIVVAAAGNKAEEDNRPFYPASYEHVISVGSIDQRNQHVKSSNYNESLTLVAPGTSIFTTTNGGKYGGSEGTSFSSPIVAGAAAILKSLQPEKTPQEIKKLLQSTATTLAEPGTSLYFGSGLLSLERLHLKLPVENIPVNNVELNTEAVTMDLSSGVSAQSVALTQLPTMNSTMETAYEQEPNDTFKQANWLYVNSNVKGTISETSMDEDFYQLPWKYPGILKLVGGWTKEDSEGGYNNQFLRLDLYDEKQNWIGKANHNKTPHGQNDLSLEVELPAGQYYVKMSQTATNEGFFIDHEYEISSNFTPSNMVQQRPNFLLGDALMKVNDRRFFLNEEDEMTNWESSNKDVASVDNDGVVVAKNPGTATITFYVGNVVKTLRVTVTDATMESKFAMYAKVRPVNATDQAVIWSSSDSSIAEVDQYGVVTAKRVGTVFVTARAGGVAAIATVNVVYNGIGYEFMSDFDNQDVLKDKVFTVTFTQPLSPFKDYSQDIVVSRESNGVTRVYEFTAKVNPLNFRQLWIKPTTYWDEGFHYLTVTKNVQNTNLLSLHKESRLMFYSYGK
ncbi:S8 family serine peptidase [Sporosarcina sp. P29]|uniref:S8 family serine peptidase n=1 Tax=Sporosarcina sp. P29 TaxID=2048252 RepID=UPI000C1653CD|nr:S8 family serine peptidase [Sporosarcina sp. P29]PIC99947.1 hypothetical protein CSV68_05695 [Sporosarcina sp. P29]